MEIRHEETTPNECRWSAWEGDKEIGFLTYSIAPDGRMRPQEIRVHPGHQRKGVATAFLRAWIERYPNGRLMEPQGPISQTGLAFLHARWELYPKADEDPLSR